MWNKVDRKGKKRIEWFRREKNERGEERNREKS
jgi:hypothetical protein